jgi:hypothetical protein
MASSAIYVSAAFSIAAAAAAETTLTVEADPLPSNPSSTVDAIIESGYGSVEAPEAYYPNIGGPLIVDPPSRDCLILLC